MGSHDPIPVEFLRFLIPAMTETGGNLTEQGQGYTEDALTHSSSFNFCCVAIDECGLALHGGTPRPFYSPAPGDFS